MLRIIKSKLFIIILITLICFIIIGVTSSRKSVFNRINNAVSVPLAPIHGFFSAVGSKVNDGLSYFSNIQKTREENEALKARIAELEKENRELLGYKDKIQELREALNLKDQFSDYDLLGANVIAKDAGNWFQVFRIDVGVRDGVDISGGTEYPILSGSKGLIGRVLSTDLTSSKVVSIIDEDSSVSGWISKPGGGNVIIKGDISLKPKGLCRMDYIPIDVDVAVNDVIETSGLGGIYPKGIVIGKVIEIKKTNSELNRYAIIKPTVDFKRLEEVYVLVSKAAGRNGGAGQ